MKLILITLLPVLALAACGQADRDAKLKQLPGYQAASATCVQCHKMPYPPDHPAVAWASIVTRMEAMIQNTGRPAPDQATHDAIVQYFEAGAKL
jgi:cytochrome c553